MKDLTQIAGTLVFETTKLNALADLFFRKHEGDEEGFFTDADSPTGISYILRDIASTISKAVNDLEEMPKEGDLKE